MYFRSNELLTTLLRAIITSQEKLIPFLVNVFLEAVKFLLTFEYSGGISSLVHVFHVMDEGVSLI